MYIKCVKAKFYAFFFKCFLISIIKPFTFLQLKLIIRKHFSLVFINFCSCSCLFHNLGNSGNMEYIFKNQKFQEIVPKCRTIYLCSCGIFSNITISIDTFLTPYQYLCIIFNFSAFLGYVDN